MNDTTDDTTDDTGPRFAPGDRVVDRDRDPDDDDDEADDGAMRVLDPDVGRADAVEIRDGTTVAAYAGNEAYPDDDRVVRVAFESWLDRTVPRWPAVLCTDAALAAGEWPENLRDYCAAWGLGLQTYDYPASRLAPYAAAGGAAGDAGGDATDHPDGDEDRRQRPFGDPSEDAGGADEIREVLARQAAAQREAFREAFLAEEAEEGGDA